MSDISNEHEHELALEFRWRGRIEAYVVRVYNQAFALMCKEKGHVSLRSGKG